jgi:hypothetical protein
MDSPTLILAWKLLTYRSPGSALAEVNHLSAFAYLFDTPSTMPTFRSFYHISGDPIRLLAQLDVTAPFYAGVAYSLGAAASKRNVLRMFFYFRNRAE